MEQSKKRKYLLIAGPLVLFITLFGLTYAFFNYTRTGTANNLGTGQIYFNTTEGPTLNLTNLFPMTSTEAGNANLDSVSVVIEGNTTYADGEEYEITLVDVNNTVNGKKIPLNYRATYTPNTDKVIGSASNDYWTEREDKDANIYKLNTTGEVKEGEQVLVGYVDTGATGIEGTLTIKAYIDADRIAISDTYYGNTTATPTPTAPNDEYGTTTEWVDNRVVLTTTEWNSFQASGTPISFKIKAESKEGIWVEEPAKGTIDSCPNCKFIYTTGSLWTTWNTESETPTVLTSGYSTNYNDIVTSSGKNFFLGVLTNASNQITNAYVCGIYNGTTPFCIEGTADGANYSSNSSFINGSSLWNNTCTVDTSEGYTDCGPWDGSSITASAYSFGDVDAGVSNDYYCNVASYGEVFCHEYDGE